MVSKPPWDENGNLIRQAKPRENKVEEYLRDKVKAQGGKAYKFVSPGNDGVPDRLTVFPGNVIVFIETKQKGKKSNPAQKNRQAELRALGCRVYAEVDSKERVDSIIQELKGLIV